MRLSCAFGISQKVLSELKQRVPSSEFCIKVQLSKWSNGHSKWGKGMLILEYIQHVQS